MNDSGDRVLALVELAFWATLVVVMLGALVYLDWDEKRRERRKKAYRDEDPLDRRGW